MSEDRLRAAVAGEVLAGAGDRETLLQSIVDVARAIFVAQATSIALVDEAAAELHFAAAAGEGRETVLGLRFPMHEGLAGSVIMTGEPLMVDDLTRDPRFARRIAEGSGYVPTAMMLAPLLRGERTLGVLSVLDRGRTERTTLQELDLLVRFADQAALAVGLGEAAQRAAGVLEGEADNDAGAVARLAGAVGALEGERREAALRLVADLAALLER
jgi:GAF domain-containing protein